MLEFPMASLKDRPPTIGGALPSLNETVALFMVNLGLSAALCNRDIVRPPRRTPPAGSSQRLRRSQTIPGPFIASSTFPLHG